MENPKILIADEHKLLAKMFEFYLKNQSNFDVAGISTSVEDLTDQLSQNKVQIVLLNSDFLWTLGYDQIAKLKNTFPNVKFIIYSNELDAMTIRRCLQIQINGFLTMNSELHELTEAVAKVSRGDLFLDMTSLNQLAQEIAAGSLRNDTRKGQPATGILKISKREKQILTLIAREYTTAAIAKQLNISQRTVDAHRRNIMLKLGVKNTAGLIKVALERKLIDADLV